MFKFLFGFLPWILYAVIANHSFVSDEIAAGLALASVFILDFKRIRKGYILECGTVLFFAALLILFLLPSRQYVALHAMLWINLALAFIMWFSILIRRPFTIQYAKESVPENAWNKPGFIRVNDILSGFWALVVTIGAFTPQWANIVGVVIAIKFTQRFPDWYIARKTPRSC